MFKFKTYILSTMIFFTIDLLWLGLFAKDLYQSKVGDLLRADVNWTAAILLYLFLNVGLLYFVIMPALEKHNWRFALLAGAFFGMLMYATYDMTNLATLQDWSVFITVVDIIWGTFLCSLTSFFTYLIIHKKYFKSK